MHRHWDNPTQEEDSHKFLDGDCIKLKITGQMTSLNQPRTWVVESQQKLNGCTCLASFFPLPTGSPSKSLWPPSSSSDLGDSPYCVLLEGGGPCLWQKLYSGLQVVSLSTACPSSVHLPLLAAKLRRSCCPQQHCIAGFCPKLHPIHMARGSFQPHPSPLTSRCY